LTCRQATQAYIRDMLDTAPRNPSSRYVHTHMCWLLRMMQHA
jgi:hypothetical protein